MRSFIAQCCLAGITEWVVCPGARDMALLQQLSSCPDLTVWTHFDERSAAFFALGRIQDTGLPVAVVTTSGTAAAELYLEDLAHLKPSNKQNSLAFIAK
jgi:2-succinyl-5-enolpyruvyl-6-hydroxy-3-cyclohexene-1-carboxylate synthase